ncbi:HWE histidine kinase domain-containing protein [Loktanella sp. SALINAS62]|uniref:sensor histidine kinase n=1 Tax=Loktanella sp. SALINAS62 TaxID=2706124 RepID=UPI001B8B186B|nr:HWE histidine kinase domain-containing protein [Loktanella sp. SALINAS62]MBS1300985.1 PAS domain-containing protein [Loktanella sp. SALINAS62]
MSQSSALIGASSPEMTAALLGLGIKVAGLGLGSIDYVNDTITLDDRAAALFDLPAHTPVPRPTLHARFHPDDIGQTQHQIDTLLTHGLPDIVDLVHRVRTPDGSWRWLRARKQVQFDTDSASEPHPVSGLVAVMDITDIKSHEDHIIAMMGEMNHRLKNVLTIVQSLARLTARTTEPDEFLPRFNARMRALGQNQNLLMKQMEGGAQLRDLVREQLSPFIDIIGAQVTIDGPDLGLQNSALQSMGLMLHELATNATKYGALSVPEGRLSITWTIAADMLTFEWREIDGPAVVAPSYVGFGSSVLQKMTAATLDGTVTRDFDPTGLHWTMTCPVAALRGAANNDSTAY